MNVNIFWRFLSCPLQEVASQVLDPEELQVGYSTESDTQQISTVWKLGDVGDVCNAPPARPSSQKRVACKVLGLSDLATGLHVSLPCCCWCAYGALMVHLWCTYGALMVLLFWFVCNLWSKFALCPGMGNDSLAICMSKKTPQKWSAEEQCEWNISCTMSYLFLQPWTLTLLVQAAFQTQTQKIPVGILKKSCSWESFAEFSFCLIWALLENIWNRKSIASDC